MHEPLQISAVITSIRFKETLILLRGLAAQSHVEEPFAGMLCVLRPREV